MAEKEAEAISPPRSKYAQDLIYELIVVQGLSYADAIVRCEQLAAPYLEAAAALRTWVEGAVQ